MKRNTFGGPASSLVESNLCRVIFDQAAKSGLDAGSVARISRTWPTLSSLIALLALTTGSGQRSPWVSSVFATVSGIASLLSQRWRARRRGGVRLFYLGCWVMRRYGLGDFQPLGNFFFASSSLTAPAVITSCSSFPFPRGATLCFAGRLSQSC